MAVIDNTGGASAVVPADGKDMFVLESTYSFATTNGTSGDIIKCFLMPTNVRVITADLTIDTVEDSTLTVDVGDYKVADDSALDAAGFFDGVSGAVAASTFLGGGGASYADGRIYGAVPSYVGVLINNNADTCVFTLRLYCMPL